MRKCEADQVRVIHGANDGTFPVAGATITSVKESLKDAFNLTMEAIAIANGKHVSGNYRLLRNDVLEFVHPLGRKGGRKGDQSQPDSSWSKTQLDAYIRKCLAAASGDEAKALLFSGKAAVHLYWAGCALRIKRMQLKAGGHGAWKQWKRVNKLADTTVNDAIRLFENARSESEVRGLGITEAKKLYVYPYREETDEEEETTSENSTESKNDIEEPIEDVSDSGMVTTISKMNPPDGVEMPPADDLPSGGEEAKGEEIVKKNKPPVKKKKPAAAKSGTGQEDNETIASNVDTTDTQDQDGEREPEPESLPKLDLVSELEEIAQRLNEIAQDELGKVDRSETDVDRLMNAASAISDGASQLIGRIGNDLAK